MKKKKRRGVRIIVTLVLICAVGAGGFYAWNTFMPGNATPASGGNGTQSVGATYTVQRMSFSVDIAGNGSLTPTKTQSIKAPFRGEIESVLAQNGDVVKEGDPILAVGEASIRDEIDQLTADLLAKDKEIASSGSSSSGGSITAPVAGILKEMYAKEDDSVINRMAINGALCLLSTDGRMKISFVPEDGATVTMTSVLKAVFELDGGEIEADCTIEAIDYDGTVHITIEDDGYPTRQEVAVKNADGIALGTGTLSANKPVYIVGDTGTIDTIRYEVGDSVSRNSTLFKLTGTILSDTLRSLIAEREALANDLADAKAKLDTLTWAAPENGVITNLSLSAGDSVEENGILYSLSSDDSFQIVIAIDELDILSVEVGQSAVVTVPALDDKEFPATVTHISSSGYTESSVTTYDVTLQLTNAEGVRSGMNAEANVTTISRDNALVVPAASIQSVNGRKFVQVASGTETSTVAVEVGVSNGTYIEILSGLNEGDSVVIPSSSSSSTSFNMGNMMIGGGTMPTGGMTMPSGGNRSGGFSGGNRPSN